MASPAASSRRSPGSSSASLKRPGSDLQASSPSISVDTLVNHLLEAKRSLSSMTLVLRANELANSARHCHEDVYILAAQTSFLRDSILDQVSILVRARRSLQATYDWGKRDFKKLVRAMDEVNGQLGATMDMLRGTGVQSVLRPSEVEKKSLLDFVDEQSVHGMRDAMKKSIEELQAIQQSFDGDLLRLDTDIRNLKKTMVDSPLPHATSDEGAPQTSSNDLLLSLFEHSSSMAQLLSSLTKHFDMCVTAIRTTEGAAALARRKAAEVTQTHGNDGVSISGVIAEQESNVSDLDPETANDRAEMTRIVVQDAAEVADVVQEIQERLAAVEQDYYTLQEQHAQTKAASLGVLGAYVTLGEMGDRLGDYLAAEEDFRTRWELERENVFGKLREMKEMRDFYERYAGAYDSLIFEVERRRNVDDRIESIWRKAQENVDKLLDGDATARESFRQDVGEFLPTDLWAGIQGPARRWQVTKIEDEETEDQDDGSGTPPKAMKEASVYSEAQGVRDQ